MSKIVVVGTSHKYQAIGGGADDARVVEFGNVLRSLCLEESILAIAEEMSIFALKERHASESIAKQVTKELGLRHQYSDPSPKKRAQLKIRQENDIRLDGFFQKWSESQIQAEILRSHEIREKYWFSQLGKLWVSTILFVCGANHCDSFSRLLCENGYEAEVLIDDWEPKCE